MTAVGDIHLSDFIVYKKIRNELRGLLRCTLSYNYSHYILHVEYHKNSVGKIIRKYCLWVNSTIDGMYVCMGTYAFNNLFECDASVMKVERE